MQILERHGYTMKGAMIKTTLREIRGSLGRYLAILAIVMLGVAFFAGLKVTTPAMIATLNRYLQEQNFFDYRLLSTLGFTEENIEELAQIEGVEDAEGSICVDALCRIEKGDEGVYKIHTLPETINQIIVTDGRLPENGTECIVDASLFDASALGSSLVISNKNEEDTLEMFAERTYTIVGLVRSPYYINFERGTTAIGNGKVNGFVYMPKDAFACDYLTEIFLTLEEDYGAYTEEYEDYIDETKGRVEDTVQEVVQARYENLISDAQEEIDEAQQELDEKSAEAEEELSSALTEIEDGEKEIADHEQEIADGKEEIQNAKDLLDAKEAELQMQEEQMNAMIQSQTGMQQPVEQYQPDMQQPTEQYQPDMQQLPEPYQSAMQQLQMGKEQIAAARDELVSKEQELLDGAEELLQAKEDLAQGREEYEDAKAEFEEEVADAQVKIDDARAELAEIEEPDYFALTRNTNIGYACYESDSNIVAAIADVFPIFFFLVAALICMTTMNRMIEEQRTQIGVLKALGYSNRVIMGKYAFYAGSAAVIGGVAGYGIGTWLFPKTIWMGYGIMYNMGELDYLFDGKMAVLSLAAALICSIGTAYLSCRYELISAPANLIRPKAPKNGKRIFLERVTFLWKRMKFLHKVSFRNMIRYKKRFFMMILGISGCTALLVAGFGIRDSIYNLTELQYENIQIYDIGLTFADPISEEQMPKIKEETSHLFDKIAYRYEESVEIDFEGQTKSVYIEIPEDTAEMGEFLKLYTKEGEPIAYPSAGEAVLTAKMAENMGIQIGDTVVVRDNDLNQFSVTISGICENFVYNYLYISKETYEESFGREPEYKDVFTRVKENIDVHEAAAEISDYPNMLSVMVVEDMRNRIETMMQSMNYIVALVIACAGALAFIVLYNLTNINITERIREIATIKVLGFYAKETADYVFRENLMLTGVGAAIGLGLGKWLHWFIMYQIRIDMVSFRTYVSPLSYCLSFFFTFVFAMFVNGLMYFKLEKINMAESLKSIE